MLSILPRRGLAAFLAWLAIASLGAAGVVRDAAASARFDGRAAHAAIEALHDAQKHVLRTAAITLSAHCRPADDEPPAQGGGGVASVAAIPAPAARIAGPFQHFTTPIPARADSRGRPYAARAPPV